MGGTRAGRRPRRLWDTIFPSFEPWLEAEYTLSRSAGMTWRFAWWISVYMLQTLIGFFLFIGELELRETKFIVKYIAYGIVVIPYALIWLLCATVPATTHGGAPKRPSRMRWLHLSIVAWLRAHPDPPQMIMSLFVMLVLCFDPSRTLVALGTTYADEAQKWVEIYEPEIQGVAASPRRHCFLNSFEPLFAIGIVCQFAFSAIWFRLAVHWCFVLWQAFAAHTRTNAFCPSYSNSRGSTIVSLTVAVWQLAGASYLIIRTTLGDNNSTTFPAVMDAAALYSIMCICFFAARRIDLLLRQEFLNSRESKQQLERLRTENERQAEEIKAEKMAMEKISMTIERELMAVTNHEVRNPLNGVVGHLRLALLDIDDKEALAQHHEAAVHCTQIALSFLASMTNLQKFKAGELQPARDPSSLFAVFRDALMLVGPQVEEGVSLQFELRRDKRAPVARRSSTESSCGKAGAGGAGAGAAAAATAATAEGGAGRAAMHPDAPNGGADGRGAAVAPSDVAVDIVTVERGGPNSDLEERYGTLSVLCDRNWLLQILINLLQNACRFTKQGMISLTVELSDELVELADGAHGANGAAAEAQENAGDGVRVVDGVRLGVRVRDSGVGMSHSVQETLFDKYASHGGVGLGLFLTRQQLHLLKSDVRWRSPWTSEHSGSEFAFDLVLQRAESCSARVCLPSRGPAAAKDDGVERRHARSAPAAQTLPPMRESPPPMRPAPDRAKSESEVYLRGAAIAAASAVPLDANAASGTPRSAAPPGAMGGGGEDGSAADGSAAERPEATQTGQPTSQDEKAAAAAQLPDGLRVLVVDDLQVNRRLLCRIFEKSMGVGWTVEQARTAQESLDGVLAGSRYDIIIMDENTGPAGEMLGSEAVRGIRTALAAAAADGAAQSHGGARTAAAKPEGAGAWPGVPELVIISCTGNAVEPHTMQRILACGADACWPKPFPNFVNGEMQFHVLGLLRAAGHKC